MVSFGIAGASATVTHLRLTNKANSSDTMTKQLSSSMSISSGDEMILPGYALQFLYNNASGAPLSGWLLPDIYWVQLQIDGYRWLQSFYVDLMTSATVPLSISGYSQQEIGTSGWDRNSSGEEPSNTYPGTI